MTEQEKQDWDELYQYVKLNVFNYDENQSLPSNIVLALKGLQTGKAVENRKIKDNAHYPFKIILLSFKLNKNKIDYAIKTKDFKSEQSKFVYIKKIVEGDLNNLYIRVKESEKAKNRVEGIDLSNLENNSKAKYTPKTKETNKKLKKYW